MGGKVLVPTAQVVRTLTAARLAADVAGVPTVLVARTDSLGANLVVSDIDPRDDPFLTGERTPEGVFRTTPGMDVAIARALAYAPYADLLWCETSTPDLDQARQFAEAVHARFPGKLLAYNCSPSVNWRRHSTTPPSPASRRSWGRGTSTEVAKIVSGGNASTLALQGSTEVTQFDDGGATPR